MLRQPVFSSFALSVSSRIAYKNGGSPSDKLAICDLIPRLWRGSLQDKIGGRYLHNKTLFGSCLHDAEQLDQSNFVSTDCRNEDSYETDYRYHPAK